MGGGGDGSWGGRCAWLWLQFCTVVQRLQLPRTFIAWLHTCFLCPLRCLQAALEFLLRSGRQPDILHCHDWSSADVARAYWSDYHHYGLWKPNVVSGVVVRFRIWGESGCTGTHWWAELRGCRLRHFATHRPARGQPTLHVHSPALQTLCPLMALLPTLPSPPPSPLQVFTIHNMDFGEKKLGDAAYFSQRFTTVSPTYAWEVGGRAGLLAACQTAWTAVGKLAVNAEKGWRIGCLYASLAVCLCVCVQEKAKKEKESAAKRKSSGGAAPSAKVCGLRGGDGVRGGVKCTCCATTASLLPALWLLTCSCVGCGCCCCCCCCRKPRRRLSQRQRRRAR